MKLLFDENLSHKLADRLTDLFPKSTHVRNVGLKSANHPDVWRFAVENSFIIVSKDADMHDRSLLLVFPPKGVWVRLGNCSTNDAGGLIRDQFANITRFINDDIASFLALS